MRGWYSVLAVLMLLVSSTVVGGEDSIFDDFQPVTITSVAVSPDDFVCAIPSDGEIQGDGGNSVFTIEVQAEDNIGVSWVTANLTNLDPELGTINLELYDDNIWRASVQATDTSAFDFSTVEIPIEAGDEAGNGFVPADGVNPVAVIVAYRMTTPPLDDACLRWGEGTTNFCGEADFSQIYFTSEIELDGSAECNDGMTMPWEGFKKVLSLNFASSLDFTDPAIGDKLQQLASAIHVQVIPPGSFGDSYIYVDSDAVPELDAEATVTIYGLPFTNTPSLQEPEDLPEDLWGWAEIDEMMENEPYYVDIEECLDFNEEMCDPEVDDDCSCEWFTQTIPNVDVTFVVPGFSQWDLTDDEEPSGELSILQDDEGIRMEAFVDPYYYTSPVSLEVYADGTGTQLSNISIYDGDELLASKEWEDIFQDCWTEDDDWETVICDFGEFDLAPEMKHYLRLEVTDFGGEEGNTYVADSITVAIDSLPPELRYLFFKPREAPLGDGIEIAARIYDEGSRLNEGSVSLQILETGEFFEFDNVEGIISAWLGLGAEAYPEGEYHLQIQGSDNLGHEMTSTALFSVIPEEKNSTLYLDAYYDFNAEEPAFIAPDGFNATVRIDVSNDFTTSFFMEQSSEEENSNLVGIPELGIYLNISAPDLYPPPDGEPSIIDEAVINVSYSDADVAAKGLEEATLRLWFYNETSGGWTKVDSPLGGVDTERNFVWAKTTHFSLWGVFGTAPVAAPASTTTSTGGGGGGGGSCPPGTKLVSGRCQAIEPAAQQEVSSEVSPEENTAPSIQDIISEPLGAENNVLPSSSTPLGVGQATGIFGTITSNWKGLAAALLVVTVLFGIGMVYKTKKK